MIKLAIIGFGTIGQGVVDVLISQKNLLKQQFDLDAKVVAISDLKYGSILDTRGIGLMQLREAFFETGRIDTYPAEKQDLDSLTLIGESAVDVVVEVTPSNLKHGQPGFDHIRTALTTGKHVITSNKGPVVLAYPELNELALKNNLDFRFESTVMSGTPVLNTGMHSLAGIQINGIKGILNGTTNYILTKMEQGASFATALAEAQELGYAETDPSGDIEGADALAKVVILGNVLLGAGLNVAHVPCEGITGLDGAMVRSALAEGARWKLIGEIRVENGQYQAQVQPQQILLTHALANVMDNMNAITFDTDLLGPVTVVGAGAGKKETAFGILNDLIQIAKRNRRGQELG